MIAHPLGAAPWLTLLFAAMGLAFGRAYFAALRRDVAAYTAAEAGALWRSIGGLLARLAAAAVFFAFTMAWGAWPLLAAFLGFLTARQLALRAARKPT
ncbi:MAG: hypothetical protein HIU85_05035 [Proteobacteria bacterium]|nr:hypothetical protein [Pseudomonadota bacterium]